MFCDPNILRHDSNRSSKGATSGMGPGCVKTPTSNFRVEILSRLRWIGKELLCQSSPKEEKGENNSSLLARVFTQPRSKTEGSAFRRYVCLSPTDRHSLVRPSVLVDFATNRNRSAIYSYALMTLETPLVRHRRDWPVSEPESARLHLA